MVDQFEEVFTQTEAQAAQDTFVWRLGSLALVPEPGLRVIVTLRVDFIGRCGELVVKATGLCLDRVAYDEEYRAVRSFRLPRRPDQRAGLRCWLCCSEVPGLFTGAY